uniref:Methyltransferase type 11 domain-containing protein n=1 Tax=Magnetococcus massalia (strain MO-1) TaxID=451514 RepID=A0A1S7LFC8_MAGMO|nr:Conserved protein of unknown function. Containing methyltransferase domain [Candidatus Magnetococcus massalia]
MPSIREWGKRLADGMGIPRYWINDCAFELKMSLVRMATYLPQYKRRLQALSQSPEPLQLVFGCGDTRYPGWIGIDVFNGPTVDLKLDLRQPLPFAEHSASLCYSEHFFEHLYPDEGMRHLREVHRILRPHGVYRIAVPAAIRFVERYLAEDDDFFKLAFPWAERPMDAIRDIMHFRGSHRNILDFEELNHMGMAAGFAQVRSSSVNGSDIEALNIDRSEPQRVAETLYVELVKGE